MMGITTVIALTGFPRKCRHIYDNFRPLHSNPWVECSDDREYMDVYY